MTIQAITSGAPIRFQDIVDAINTYYPEYGFLLPVTLKGSPFLLDQTPRTTNPQDWPSCLLLAMICPPNCAARPLSLGGYPIDTSFVPPPAVGITPEMVKGSPIFAPNFFKTMTSANYAGGGSLGTAITDVETQLDNFRIARPDVRVLGNMITGYTKIITGVQHAVATCMIAGKT